MRNWLVTFTAEGVPLEATEIEGPGDADWVVVTAESAEEALRVSVRAYARLKKKKVRARLHAEGRCRCGRPQRDGFKTCQVCAEYMKRYRDPKPWETAPKPMAERDEGARVLAFQETSRNRKQETRLEVLLEVRKWWKDAPHTAAFAERLATEIQAAGGVDRAGQERGKLTGS